MALFSSVFRQLFERVTHLRRRETPQMVQQCALEREIKRKMKKSEINERSRKNKAEEARETLSLENIKERGYVQTTEPTPLVEVKPQQTSVSPAVRSSFLKPIEGNLPMLPSVSEHFSLPATRFKPQLPMTKPPMHPQKPAPPSEEVSLPCSPLQVHPPKLLVVLPSPISAPDELLSHQRLLVPPSSTPAPNEVVALQCSSAQVSPLSLVKPQPSTSSLFEPPPQLMLIDIEDEENEYVKYTGRTIRGCDLLVSERPRPLEAKMNPRLAAWVESDSEVLEEVLVSEVVEVQGCEEEKDDPNEVGDSKAIQGHSDVTKKERDEHMTKPFCVANSEGPKNKTQPNVNIEEEQANKRKVALVLFTWIEDETKNKEEKKIQKEKERREKRLLLARYRNDPKRKHLLINMHDCSYCFSE